MNVFELSAVATPIAGAIAGAASVKSPGVTWMILGACLGLAIGLTLYFVAMGLSALLGRVPDVNASEKLRPLQWLASATSVFLPMLAPVAAIALSALVVTSLLRL